MYSLWELRLLASPTLLHDLKLALVLADALGQVVAQVGRLSEQPMPLRRYHRRLRLLPGPCSLVRRQRSQLRHINMFYPDCGTVYTSTKSSTDVQSLVYCTLSHLKRCGGVHVMWELLKNFGQSLQGSCAQGRNGPRARKCAAKICVAATFSIV